ncbi:alkane 1-monooxygenase [Aliidongia dinghuensis]|uniref:Luciferase-like monooxygenase n=1 Tax=Aliidongia dinghuensis TaxID=1867774 RepID=A0A8J2YRL0_9PROT|nr:LLM class flavin-dependent oxidoreductase [Aliidongia dinghuensis]GGF10113.1 alkane 1-monooxygenase [Aliidongia dinghuensis]
MTALSLLDLSPIPEGHDARQALLNSVDLARHAEGLGYRRFWVAEHHNMPGIASAATAVVIGHIAGGTRSIRVGAGGIMLPNHAPLVIAEQFGTLASLYPGRIDLGLGRAPGTDQATAQALRRTLTSEIDSFPQDVLELIGYLGPAEAGQRIRAVPGTGTNVPVWILGSSTYGAQLAAAFGLPYAFASHFAPDQLEDAIAIYRERFRPSAYAEKPHVMVGLGAFAAETDAEARFLFSSQQQAFANLRRGRPGPLPRPVADIATVLSPVERAMVEHSLGFRLLGSPETIRRELATVIERTQADELMVTGAIHDHQARLRSFEIVAEAFRAVAGGTTNAAAD